MFSALDANTSLDDSARKALKRRLNPVVDLAAAAEDKLTADGYGLAHNAARSELVSSLAYMHCSTLHDLALELLLCCTYRVV